MTKTEQIIKFLPCLSDSLIAKHLQCSKELVRQVRNRQNTPSPAPHLRCAREDLEEDDLLYAKRVYDSTGWNIQKVAKEVFGSENDYSFVYRVFRERGWVRKFTSRGLADVYIDFLKIKNREDLSCYELFKLLKGKVSVMTIWRWKKRDKKK